ncbi:MAG: hypothetical protein JWM68_4361 [Verrucomicrobiales bacterium]|nr:hypothetical protein [Verrucomicrobiales bacterium]
MRDSVFHILAEAARTGERVALGIITGVKGSSPQKVGAKALFYSDGRIESTLGGGCLEAEVQQRAIRSLQTNECSKFDLVLDHDFGWDDGLICGGKVFGLILPNAQDKGERFWRELAERNAERTWAVTDDFSIVGIDDADSGSVFLYQEIIHPPCNLWIAGAGHIAQAVAPFAVQLDFKVSVFDDRPALANHRFFPEAVHISTEDWSKLATRPFPGKPTFGLIVTRGHRHDALVLRDWIQKPFAFVGMIGSARKARIIFDHFVEEKIATAEQIQRIACPVGIDIDSKTVAEIAVSIVAQLIEKRAGLR